MRIRHAALIAVLCAAFVHAQTALPEKPDPGIRTPREPSMKTPSDPGVVVEPPATDSKAVVTPPKNVDPAIDDATPDIDRKNRKKSQDKRKPK